MSNKNDVLKACDQLNDTERINLVCDLLDEARFASAVPHCTCNRLAHLNGSLFRAISIVQTAVMGAIYIGTLENDE